MKKSHIIGIVLIAVAIGAIFASLGNASTYASFSTAQNHEGREFHVVGKLDKSKEMLYQPEKDPNIFLSKQCFRFGTLCNIQQCPPKAERPCRETIYCVPIKYVYVS